jgi:hypothetical protein
MTNDQLKMSNGGILSEFNMDNNLHLTFEFWPLSLVALMCTKDSPGIDIDGNAFVSRIARVFPDKRSCTSHGAAVAP